MILVDPGIRVHADRALVRQLLDNLIGNAVKYVAPGTRPRIRVCAVREGEHERVTVSDNGIGIPEQHRTRVFETFHRAHPGEDYQGTGLGLAICQRVVERHGGEIRVADTPPGTGTRIELTLRPWPRSRSRSPPRRERTRRAPRARPAPSAPDPGNASRS